MGFVISEITKIELVEIGEFFFLLPVKGCSINSLAAAVSTPQHSPRFSAIWRSLAD